ncbi:MAG: hypothetical protein WCO83_12295 [Alphaproteobacteria bacterium]
MKLTFASSAWVDEARRILNDLVSAHGEIDRRFSVCERFTSAPLDMAPSGNVAWYFRIDGKSVEVASGEITDADVEITADYQTTLPIARLVYTPEFLAARRAAANQSPNAGRKGDMSKAPPYLVELHNRLALVTA